MLSRSMEDKARRLMIYGCGGSQQKQFATLMLAPSRLFLMRVSLMGIPLPILNRNFLLHGMPFHSLQKQGEKTRNNESNLKQALSAKSICLLLPLFQSFQRISRAYGQ